jgi:hypothetical protein
LFDQVQESVNKAPPLYFVDYNAPVYLHTDASDFGIGAHLFQLKDGKELPIAFLSKALNPTEIKWSVPEKRMLRYFLRTSEIRIPIKGYQIYTKNGSS